MPLIKSAYAYVLAEQLMDTPTNANSRVNWTTHLQSHVHY